VEINSWWEGYSDEVYWIEVTQRGDLGADLRAPQTNESGHPYWSYALIRDVRDGDIVFHYSKRDHAISLWSRAVGGWWEDEIFWGARGTVGRAKEPYDRPGWVHGLDGPFMTTGALTLEELRRREDTLADIRDAIEDDGPLYFPFEIGEQRPLRTGQGYLFKLPAAVVAAFPELKPRAETGRTDPGARGRRQPGPRSAPGLPAELGSDYRRPADDVPPSQRDPFEVDPTIVDRGVRGHRHAQNALADHLERLGIEPRSPTSNEPQYDLGWTTDDGLIWIAEVKSLTRKNEERQLRLGLGQLLRYRNLLSRPQAPAQAVLMIEREPTDASWLTLCAALDVLLTWPANLPGDLHQMTMSFGRRRRPR
jgi:hypothetical protein